MDVTIFFIGLHITDYGYAYVPIKSYVKIKQRPQEGITYSLCYVALLI